MRILHFADLHIGVESYGRTDPATGLSTRLLDFLRAFDELVEFALREQVDLVLFCGDAYRSRDPSQTHQREFARRIGRLAAAGIPVFLLVGNHDLPNALGRATALEIFPTLAVPNVHVAPRIGTHIVPTQAGPLQVVALPWVTRSRLLTQDEYRNAPLDRVTQVMEEKLVSLLQEEAAGLDPVLPALLAGHITLSTARTGSEVTMMVGRDPVVMKSNLAPIGSGLDYVALGHIHRRQELDGPVPAVYSGSMQRVDFGEEDQEKGFYLIDIDEKAPRGQRLRSYTFVPVWARPFVTIEVRADGANPTEAVLRAIRRHETEVQEAIVRIQVRLPQQTEALLDEAAIRRALADAHVIAAISREVKREQRTRLGDVAAETLTPLQALELYLDSKKTPKERTRVLLEHARRLMEGEEAP